MGKSKDTTTKFRADISELKAGMQEASRQIRLANAQFKAASAGMDDWSKSTDGLSAKIEQLNSVQDAENKKLKMLKESYALVLAEQGENSTAAQELQIKIANQSAAVSKAEKNCSTYKQKLDELKNAESSASDEAKQSISTYDKLKSAIDEQSQKIVELKSKYAEIVLAEGKGSDSAKSLSTEISKLSQSLQENKDKLEKAESAADSFDKSMQDSKESTEKLSGGFSILKGAIADLAADGIKKAIGAFGELLTSGDKALNSFQAQTGKSGEDVKKFDSAIKDLYKNNYGESITEISDAMAKVTQNSKETDPSKIKELTKNAIVLKDTFGYDISESMRSVNMLMDQFGISSDEAFSLVAQGAQNGLDKNGDMLDSINEYSVHYKNQGYSANEFFNSLKNGTDAGTFSVDKLGDAMKEFGIRTKDGSKTTAQAFSDLGLNSQEMNKKFAAGGDSAKAANKKVIDSLFAMKDKVKQNQTGVALFGSMWEDLGADGIKALKKVDGGISSTKDSMKQIDDVKYDDIGSGIEGVGRQLKTDLLDPLVNKLLPYLKKGIEWAKKEIPAATEKIIPPIKAGFEWLKDHIPEVTATIVGLATTMAVLFVANKIMSLVKAFQAYKAATEGATVAQWLLNAAQSANPIGIIVALIAGLVAAFVVLWLKCDWFRNFWIGLWETIKNGASAAWEGIKSVIKAGIDAIVGFFTGIINFVKTNWKALLLLLVNPFAGAFKLLYDNCEGFRAFVDKWVAKIKQFFSNLWTGIKNIFSTVGTFFITVFSTAWDGIKSYWSGVGTFFKGIWSGIKGAFGSVATWFKDTFSKAWEGVKNVFSKGGKIFSGIKDGISSVFKTVVNKLIGGINAVISVPFKSINGMLNKIHDISIVGKKPFSGLWDSDPLPVPEIPQLFKGGVLEKGQTGYLEGNGDEAVVPLEKNTHWLDVVASKLSSKLRGARDTNRGSDSSKHYNFYQTNNSPKALSRLEIYRQTKNQIAFAKGG